MSLNSLARLVHLTSKEGHRQDYQDVLSKALDLTPSTGRVSAKNFVSLVSAKTLLFGSLDDDVFGFVMVALTRMFAGRATAGLFLRPHSCFFRSNPASIIKYYIFYLLTKLRSVSVYTILPFEVEPDYGRVAKQGLADPQLWDRCYLPVEPSTEFAMALRQKADGRRVMAFIGSASSFKGVTYILQMMKHPDWDNKVCVMFAGKVPDEMSGVLREAELLGALVVSRFISNAELAAVYDVADVIWAGYQQGYDQASGNFGRALQAGKIPVVRDGTLIARLAASIGYPVIDVDFDQPELAIAKLQGQLPRVDEAPVDQISQWRNDFIKTMLDTL